MGVGIEVGRAARARAKERFLPDRPAAHHPLLLGHRMDQVHRPFAGPDTFGGGDISTHPGAAPAHRP